MAWQDYSGSKDYSRLTSRFMREDSEDGLSMTDIMRAMPSKRVHHADDVGMLVGHLALHWQRIRSFMFQPKIVSQNALHNHPPANFTHKRVHKHSTQINLVYSCWRRCHAQ